MKNINFTVCLLLFLTIMLLPLIALGGKSPEKTQQTAAGFVSESSNTTSENPKEYSYNTYVRLYNEQTKKIEKLELREYIYGVVAGECPMLYHDEAIKAQIVAAKTYTLYRMRVNAKAEYDVTTEPETSQNYITREKAFENWGSNAETYDKKLNSLIDEVYNYCVLYKDVPILAVYHAISSGKTESSKNVWNSELPYLIATESVGDKLADGYLTEPTFSIAEANGILKAEGITATALSNAKLQKTESGNVLSLAIGEKELTGSRMAEMFSLRSNNFDIKVDAKKLTFTVRGYGHQVGLSQNGANYMAKAGSSFDQILTHYYSGTTVAEYIPKNQ